MLALRKPTPQQIESFLRSQSAQDFTYRNIGATAGEPPARYVVDHTRVEMGSGDAVFDAARAALEAWEQFSLPWLSAAPETTPIEQDAVIAIVARTFGVWWLNACRIVYVIDESDAFSRRFGFAYGTLPDHAGTGEERFLIEKDRNGTVWYDILAFSRPHHLLARLGYPVVRHIQRRFGRESAQSMQLMVHRRLSAAEESPGHQSPA